MNHAIHTMRWLALVAIVCGGCGDKKSNTKLDATVEETEDAATPTAPVSRDGASKPPDGPTQETAAGDGADKGSPSDATNGDVATTEGGGSVVCGKRLTACGSLPDGGGPNCVDTTEDEKNCGGCGTVCTEGRMCITGACACGDRQAMCGTACATLETDPNNCGMCGKQCPSGACSRGACVAACPMAEMNCDGRCVNIKTDNEHCGACNSKCRGRRTCQNGMCELPATLDAGGPG